MTTTEIMGKIAKINEIIKAYDSVMQELNDAVKNNMITEEQYKIITKKDYVENA